MIKLFPFLIILPLVGTSRFEKSDYHKAVSTFNSDFLSDTIVFNRKDTYNALIFGKSNWLTTAYHPNHRNGESINPYYDTIFNRKDSSRYNGYLKMLSEEIYFNNDTVHNGVSLFKVSNGIPKLIHSYTIVNRHPETNHKVKWKHFETIVSDSSLTRLTFYPNGQIQHESINLFLENDTLDYFNSFDSTGILLYRNANKLVLKDGLYPFSLKYEQLYDQNRQREIPIALYKPLVNIKAKQKLVIFSHGYGQNKGGDHLAYSYLTEFLASRGYFVVSIQHELPTDSLLPLNGIPQIVRRPFWECGADNILFVIKELKKSNPEIDFKHITLIGHSNGGDMTALFPQKYPNKVEKIITLDNRRMTFPKSKKVKVYTLRSSDQPADKGVLPSEKEIEKFRMTVVKLLNTTHNEMDDNANDEQRKEIQKYILTFLND